MYRIYIYGTQWDIHFVMLHIYLSILYIANKQTKHFAKCFKSISDPKLFYVLLNETNCFPDNNSVLSFNYVWNCMNVVKVLYIQLFRLQIAYRFAISRSKTYLTLSLKVRENMLERQRWRLWKMWNEKCLMLEHVEKDK